jgi:hypothetical protein
LNSIKSEAPTPKTRYVIRIGAESRGPYDVPALETLALNGAIVPTTLLAREDSTDFKPIAKWSFFEQVFPAKTWTMAKTPPAFEIVNRRAKEPDAGSAPPTNRRTKRARMRAIASMEEFEARSAADPSDPVIIGMMNEVTSRLKEDGVSREKALNRIFAANRDLNRSNDKMARNSRAVEKVMMYRSTATKYAATVALVCLGLIYFFPESQTNGIIALCVDGATYGICVVSAYWIVSAPPIAGYLLTALELYVFGWAVWVAIAVLRGTTVSDPFLALFHCLIRWHL